MHCCPEYEERILDGDTGVELHVAGCPDCREFASALARVDMTLGIQLRRAAMAAPMKPPLWPEVLDFAGWASIAATALVVAPVIAPAEWKDTVLAAVFGLLMAAGACYMGFKSWRELT